MLRFLRLALLGAAFAAVFAAPAHAVRVVLPETLTSTHFQIHFDGDPTLEHPVTYQQAGELAANLERAYETMTGVWGFPAPLNDGDGKVDVYVTDTTPANALGFAFPDTAANQTSGYIHIDDGATEMPDLAAHELFHLVQFGMFAPGEEWLMEATAEWAAFRFVDFPTTLLDSAGAQYPLADTLGMPDMSLNCGGEACGLSGYESGGYSRWHFFQFAQERFGSSFVKEVFDNAKAMNDPALGGIDFIVHTLAARGATISDTLTDWTVANLTGNYATSGLKGVVPPAYSSTLTGTSAGALPAQKVAVNHLAARFLEFKRGDGSAGGLCYAATLTLNVTLPPDLGARPYFYWPGTGAAVPLAISGGTATLSVPWDTCTWPLQAGRLALPNPSSSVDAALFTVSCALAVDKQTIVTPTSAPPGSYIGPTVPAPTTDEPPAIAVYGPELIRVSRKTRTVRLVVFSSGVGKLRAKLGGSSVGTRSLRTGNNDLRFTLPRTALRSLNARGTLTLTSLSPSGITGATVKRKITLTK